MQIKKRKGLNPLFMARGGCKATDRKTINYSTFKVIVALIFLFFFFSIRWYSVLLLWTLWKEMCFFFSANDIELYVHVQQIE